MMVEDGDDDHAAAESAECAEESGGEGAEEEDEGELEGGHRKERVQGAGYRLPISWELGAGNDIVIRMLEQRRCPVGG